MEVNQLRLVVNKRLPQSNREMTLWEVVQDLINGRLHIPYHQRDFVWVQHKKEGWIERLMSDIWPVGCLVTYQLATGEDTRVYVNDGTQRLRTLVELVMSPQLYGLSPDYVESLLRSVSMSVQHRPYASQFDAFLDYQGLNWGTPLTPHEFHKGYLTTIPSYEFVWKPIIEQVDLAIRSVEAAVISERRQRTKKQESSLARDSLATFYRFISSSTERTDFAVGSQGKRGKKTFEYDLRDELERQGPERIKVHLKAYQTFIEQQTALIRDCWYRVLNQPDGSGINLVSYRWLLCASVWRRNANVPLAVWKEFLVAVLRVTQGRGRFDTVDEAGVTKIGMWLSYNNLEKLNEICRFVGVDMESSQVKRPRRNPNTRPGYDDSHVLPFSIHGNGATFPEPAGVNRARGARPVE